jgi:transcriptional regulator with XRE-family HTH domain
MPTSNTPTKRGRPPKAKEVEADTVMDAGAEIIKRKPHESSPVIGDNGMLVKGDEKRKLTARLLTETLATYDLPRVKSDEELAQRIGDYFNRCARTGEKPTVEQMAQCTGYSLATVWDWENGRNNGFSTSTSEIIKKSKDFLKVFDAKLLMEGALNPVSYIFRAKNYYGMKDVQDYILTPNNPLGSDSDPATLAEKYQQALPE